MNTNDPGGPSGHLFPMDFFERKLRCRPAIYLSIRVQSRLILDLTRPTFESQLFGEERDLPQKGAILYARRFFLSCKLIQQLHFLSNSIIKP